VIPSPQTVAVQAYCVMCAWRVDQMVFFKKDKKLSILQKKQETKLFEFVMDEINSNNRQQGTWGKAIAEKNGDLKKAEANYITLRVEELKDEIELNNIIEDEKLKEIQQITKDENKKKVDKKNSPFPPLNI